MSEDKEFKSYDSYVRLSGQEMRLTKDPDVVNPTFVKLSTVMNSSNSKDSPTWLTIVPSERDAETASYLRKGNVFHFEGFPVTQVWGDNGDKRDLVVKFPKLIYPQATREAMKALGCPAFNKGGASPGPKRGKKLINLDD